MITPGTDTTTQSAAQHFMHLLAQGRFCLPFDRYSHHFVELVNLEKADTGAIEWRAASGRGTLLGKAVYHRQYHDDFPTPYAVGIVTLEEGPFLVARLDGAPDRYTIGMRVAAKATSGGLVFLPLEDIPDGQNGLPAAASDQEET